MELTHICKGWVFLLCTLGHIKCIHSVDRHLLYCFQCVILDGKSRNSEQVSENDVKKMQAKNKRYPEN